MPLPSLSLTEYDFENDKASLLIETPLFKTFKSSIFDSSKLDPSFSSSSYKNFHNLTNDNSNSYDENLVKNVITWYNINTSRDTYRFIFSTSNNFTTYSPLYSNK